MQEFKTEKAQLQSSIQATNTQIQKKDLELEGLKQQLSTSKAETESVKSDFKGKLQNAEQDKKNLQQKITNLEASLAESQANANIMSNIDATGDPVLAKLKQEKEAQDGQIEFLNSVIVEMQRKNEDLKVRLEAMESGGVINGTTDYDSEPVSRTPAPRLFCDICEVFDLHETDDCPRQAMDDSPPATHYHGSRDEQRAYCTICEVFGHTTEDCDDEQTF